MEKKSMKNFQGYKIWEKAATYHRAWPITFLLVKSINGLADKAITRSESYTVFGRIRSKNIHLHGFALPLVWQYREGFECSYRLQIPRRGRRRKVAHIRTVG